MRWSEVMNKVAASLAARQLPDAEGDPDNPVSMLTALTGSIPPGLRRRLRLGPLGPLSQNKANNDVEPLIYQNEFPVRLLAVGIVDVAAQAVGAASDQECPRVTAITAIAALSTLRLDPGEEGATLLHVHRRMRAFGSAEWTAALDALARRTAELDELLAAAAGDRRQGWHRVALADRILGEAVAAAVVGGAAQASGVPPREWLFPFHLFCNLGVSAAGSALSTVERWLGIEFLPEPRTPARAASLAALVADEASALWRGCGCKAPAEDEELGFARRGPCRQDDHDLRVWRPGSTSPAAAAARGTPPRCGAGSAAGSAALTRAARPLPGRRRGRSCAPTTWPQACWPAAGCRPIAASAARCCVTTASCRSSAAAAAARCTWSRSRGWAAGRWCSGRPAAGSSIWSIAVSSSSATAGACSAPSWASWSRHNRRTGATRGTAPSSRWDRSGYAVNADATHARPGTVPNAARGGSGRTSGCTTDGCCCRWQPHGLT